MVHDHDDWDNTEFSVEHTVKEERKIRTDWIGHLGKSVEQIDPVGLRVKGDLAVLLNHLRF